MKNEYRKLAIAFLFILDHQQLDEDARSASDFAKLQLLRLERRYKKLKGGS